MYTRKEETQVFIAESSISENKAKRLRLILVMSAFVVLITTMGLTLFFIEKTFSAKYEHAVALMSSDALSAKEEFLEIGSYRDSAGKARECQNRIDYDSADTLLASGDYSGAREIFLRLGDFGGASEKVLECDYAKATEMMNLGKPQEAKEAFLALGDYSDSGEQARQCQNEIDYIAAAELLSQKDYTNALEAFKSLGNYKDSAGKAEECSYALYNDDYVAAIALLGKKDYAKALEAFNSLGYYKDSADKLRECQNNLDYIAADKAFSEGKFYTAYRAFKMLGSFSDSAERAASCLRPNPASGQVYRNPRYADKTCPVTFIAADDGYSTYIKIYKGDTLVSGVFIASGKQATVKLPVGTYTIIEVTGFNWFGRIEAFGADGRNRTIMDGNAKLVSGTNYKLKLRF